MEMVIFWVLAAVAVGAALGVVAQRSAVRSALFLLVHFCCLAGLYILLNAQFVALVQVLIYAGAVVVLFLFVVMLLGVERAEELPDLRRVQQIVGGLLAVLLLAGIAWAFVATGQGPDAATGPPSRWSGVGKAGSVRAIGAALLTAYAVPFEMAAVLLLVAIVGAIVLAKSRLER
jgi:NADH-quinone oxidoreductase subunit J